MRPTARTLTIAAAAFLFAACSGTASVAPTAAPTTAATTTPTAAPTATPDPCAAANLKTLTSGTLTVGTDNPAYPPYYEPTDPKPTGSTWEFGDPTNGKGLESATAYAVATKLAFAKDHVTWVVTPFNNAIQPGPKAFDIYLTQVSWSAERAQAVDLSDGYFDLNQAVVALTANSIAKVTDVAGLKAFRLGAPVGTTSYTYITDQIQPTKVARVYDTLDAAVLGLNAKQIDGIVVDLPTAFFLRDGGQLKDASIVGSLPTVGQVEHFSIVLNKGSSLTACVNGALAAMKADGTLKSIVDEWIKGQGAPELK
jgi:polar amino acid transport system substrate-binding protein